MHDAVAIVGLACVLPGAPDAETFWANVVDGVDSVTEVPPTRWRTALHFDPDGDRDEPMSVSKWGGFVPDVGFDALAWGIPPASLAAIDPAQLLALHCAAAALDDAGYGVGDHRDFDRERASVVYATGSGGASDVTGGVQMRLWLRNHGIAADALPPELDAFLPRLTEDGLPGALTSVIAGRVANRLDLGGKNLTVDSACASVLVALDIARNELLARSSDLVLCGGVDLHNGAQDFVSFTAAQALSPGGRCRSFDADADGMTLAEGAGCLVLKRLSDAVADDDRIYAVVQGVAGSSDGRHLGLTAPRQDGQVRALRRAYAAADLSPRQVGLVEAHGTGTPTGDRIELSSTTQVFTEAGAATGSVVLGSSKSNIGHTKCAAGIASLIKAAKALYHQVQPSTLHIRRPNEAWDESSPFAFLDRSRPWPSHAPTYAGVSAFGFGGTNFHALLSASPSSTRPGTADVTGRPHWPAELVVLRAASDEELADRVTALAARLEEELTDPRPADRWRLRDVALAMSTEPVDGPVRLAIVATCLDDLARQLRTAEPVDHPAGRPKVAFLVPDEPGRAHAEMHGTADLVVAFPSLRAALPDDVATLAAMFPPQAFDDDMRARQRTALADVGEQAITAASQVAVEALALGGVTPDVVVHRAEATPEALRQLADDGVTVFVDVGPGDAMAPTVDHTLADLSRTTVAVDRPGVHGLVGLLHALARLAVAQVPVDVAALHRGRGSDPERWWDPPPRPGWLVNGHCARDAAGRPLPKGLRPADEAPALRLVGRDEATPTPTPPGADGPATAPELAPVLGYLTLVQQTIAAGSEIIRHELTER